MGNTLFRNIIVSVQEVRGKLYPTVNINELNRPDTIAMDDYFVIERIRINNDNDGDIMALDSVFVKQNIMYHLCDKVYVTAGGHYTDGISFPESQEDGTYSVDYMDIKRGVQKGIKSYTDLEADIDKFSYIYRLLTHLEAGDKDTRLVDKDKHSYYAIVSKLKSQYMVLTTDAKTKLEGFSVTDKEINIEDKIIGRKSRDRRYIISTIPATHNTPRFRGPIDYTDIKVFIDNNLRLLASIEEDMTLLNQYMDAIIKEVDLIVSAASKIVSGAELEDVGDFDFLYFMDYFLYMSRKLHMGTGGSTSRLKYYGL